MLTVIVRAADGSARTLAFDQPQVTVGRDANNDICFPVNSVSKFHARLTWQDGGCKVEDLGSTNGTTIDGQTVQEAVVGPRAAIGIGDFVLRVQVQPGTTPRPTPPNLPAVAPPPREPEKPAVSPLAAPPAALDAKGLAALRLLLERASASVDAAKLARPVVEPGTMREVEEALTKLARGMSLAGEVPVEVKASDLIATAFRELVDLGALGPLLDDPRVTRIQCLRHDILHVTKDGRTAASPFAFSSGAALRRAIDRLALRAGRAWEKTDVMLERRLASGGRIVATAPPLTEQVTCTITPRVARGATMQELVAAGVLAPPMVAFLQQALLQRVNIFISGTAENRAGVVLSALVGACPPGDRVAVVHASVDIGAAGRSLVSLALPMHRPGEQDVLRAAHALAYERVVVTDGRPDLAAKALEAAADGSSASIIAIRGRTLEEAILALMAQVAIAHPGIGADAASALVRTRLSLGIQLGAAPNGTLRIVRIAELAAGTTGIALRDRFALGPAPTTTAAATPPKVAAPPLDDAPTIPPGAGETGETGETTE
jgi:pilus assembly protein CpaF